LAIRADHVQTLESYRQESCAALQIILRETWLRENALTAVDLVSQLKQVLQPHQGGPCRVTVRYERLDAHVRLRLGESWSLNVGDELLRSLTRWLGADAVQLRFRPPQRSEQPKQELAYSG